MPTSDSDLFNIKKLLSRELAFFRSVFVRSRDARINPAKPEYRNMYKIIVSICIYVKIALTKKKKIKNFDLLRNSFFVTYMSHTVLKGI